MIFRYALLPMALALSGCGPRYVVLVDPAQESYEDATLGTVRKLRAPKTVAAKPRISDVSAASAGTSPVEVTGSLPQAQDPAAAAQRAEAERMAKIVNRLSAPLPAICARC